MGVVVEGMVLQDSFIGCVNSLLAQLTNNFDAKRGEFTADVSVGGGFSLLSN